MTDDEIDEMRTVDKAKVAAKVLGPYRIVIDGAMILAMATLLVQASSWKTEVEMLIRANQKSINESAEKIAKIEHAAPNILNIPITREAAARISVLETALQRDKDATNQALQSIDNRLGRIEDAVGRLK